MKREYTFAGFGGQGILFMGQVLAHAAMFAGFETSWMPSYGPEMRGGTANCSVVISDRKVRSPLVYRPDLAVVFNNPSLQKFGPRVKPGGTVLMVADLIDGGPDRDDVAVYPVPARGIAERLGHPAAVNMVMAGALLAVDPTVTPEQFEAALRTVTPAHRLATLGANLQAIREGMGFVTARRQDRPATGGGGE